MTSLKLSLEINNDLDDLSKKLAEDELRETPERAAAAVAELRKLLKENTDLNFDESDEFLTMILRPCKFYPESALTMLQNIAEFRRKYADNLQELRQISNDMSILNTKVVNVLADRDQCRRRILLLNMGGVWNTDTLKPDMLFQLMYLMHFGALMEPTTQIHGIVIIMDFSGLGFKQAKSFTPAFSLRLLTFIQKAMPLRLKAVHIVNESSWFKMVWAIFQPFIEKKLKSRIYFHGTNRTSLHKYVNVECLPADYGGSLPNINYNLVDWHPFLADHEQQIETWHNQGFVQKK